MSGPDTPDHLAGRGSPSSRSPHLYHACNGLDGSVEDYLSDLVRGQLSDTAWRLTAELPVFGRFVSLGRDPDEIWRRGPRRDAALRDEVIDRAADLVDQLRGEVAVRFTDLSGELEAQLAKLEDMVRRGVTDPALGQAFYLAILNEGIIGDQDLAASDSAARYLTETDLRILLMVYDRVGYWEELASDNFDGRWPYYVPRLTAFEAGYRLARLRDFGFLCSDPAMTAQPGEYRIFTTELNVIDDFIEGLSLARPVAVSPSMEYAGIVREYEAGNLATFITETKGNWYRPVLHCGVVRRHLLFGYQWIVVASDHKGEFPGAFATAAEAQSAAAEELRLYGLPVNWIPIGA